MSHTSDERTVIEYLKAAKADDDGLDPVEKRKYMVAMHQAYPELDWLMIQLLVEHYMRYPDDTPEQVLAKAPKNYFVDPDTEVTSKEDTHPDDIDLFSRQREHPTRQPQQQRQEEEDVGDTTRSDGGCISGGSSTIECSSGSRDEQPEHEWLGPVPASPGSVQG